MTSKSSKKSRKTAAKPATKQPAPAVAPAEDPIRAATEALSYLKDLEGEILDGWILKDGGILMDAMSSIRSARNSLEEIVPEVTQ